MPSEYLLSSIERTTGSFAGALPRNYTNLCDLKLPDTSGVIKIIAENNPPSQRSVSPITNYQKTASEVVNYNLLIWKLLQANFQSTQNTSFIEQVFSVPFWRAATHLPVEVLVSDEGVLIDEHIEMKPNAVFSGQIRIQGVERGKPSSLLFEGSDSDLIEE